MTQEKNKTFPHTCEICGYVSNNYAMRYYHRKTHQPIPEGKLCDFGCGRPAKFINTNGKFVCEKITHHCPEYIRKHSQLVKEQWKNASEQRRENTRNVFLKACVYNDVAMKKSKETRWNHLGFINDEDMKKFKKYSHRIRSGIRSIRSQFKQKGVDLGITKQHIDHKLSVLDAWKLQLPSKIVNHPLNLEIIDYMDNVKKGPKSSITIQELLESIKKSGDFNGLSEQKFMEYYNQYIKN